MKYTKESLQNTWGIVESKEHAEVIIGLAENAGFEQRTGLEKAYPCYFCLDEDEIYFFSQKHNASNDGEKQITIPLPPKAKVRKPDFSKLPKHFDCVCNKCGGKCCIGNCGEWPKVGDKVTWGEGVVSGEIKAISEGLAWIKNEYGNYCSEYIASLKKPKTPEEEVESNLIDLIMRARDADADDVTIARSILSKYNITKKDKADE